MTKENPNIITSGKSQRITVDSLPFSIEIYRLETDPHWTLEVVDCEGTSYVWDDHFTSDKDARNAAVQVIEKAPPPSCATMSGMASQLMALALSR